MRVSMCVCVCVYVSAGELQTAEVEPTIQELCVSERGISKQRTGEEFYGRLLVRPRLSLTLCASARPLDSRIRIAPSEGASPIAPALFRGTPLLPGLKGKQT